MAHWLRRFSLEIGHQQRRGDAFSGDVADDEAEALSAKVQKVEIVTAHRSRLMARTSIFQGFQGRLGLRKKTSLHFFCDLQFVSRAAFRVQLFGDGAALRFDGVRNLVEADKRKGIAVEIFEAGEYAAPDRCLIFG